MEYISIFVGWFLEHFTSEDVSMVNLITTLGLSCLNGIYLFVVYRMFSRKTFYSKRYNITLASMVVIITAIIFTVQSSMIISLGMVGALSIIRFRTAIKDAMDIVFLFWAVTLGICYGAHMSEIAIFLSSFMTLLLFSLDNIVSKRGFRILIVEMEAEKDEIVVLSKLREWSKSYKVKERVSDKKKHKVIVEVKVKQEFLMLQELQKFSCVNIISLIDQDGETTY